MAFQKLVSQDVTIAGEEWPDGKGFTIYEFFSNRPRQGNARRALVELARQFGELSVTDIGFPGDDSYKFWRYMLQTKAIHSVHDEQGCEHVVAVTMRDGCEAE